MSKTTIIVLAALAGVLWLLSRKPGGIGGALGIGGPPPIPVKPNVTPQAQGSGSMYDKLAQAAGAALGGFLQNGGPFKSAPATSNSSASVGIFSGNYGSGDTSDPNFVAF
jgi:hypothetical protein